MACLSEWNALARLSLMGAYVLFPAETLLTFSPFYPNLQRTVRASFYPLRSTYLMTIVNQDRSGSPEPETNGFEDDDDARAQTIAYRTVKRTHIDKISSPMGSSKHDWKNAKAALG